MDLFPIVFGTFKVVALAVGMYFAIKWHYDQGRKANAPRVGVMIVGKVAALFLLVLFGLGFATFTLAKKLGMDLSFYW